MQDEFGYPVFTGGDASPRNMAASQNIGKKSTMIRFTDDIMNKRSMGGSEQPSRGGGGNNIMDNPRLAKRSETFLNDDGVKVIKRCYFLAIGDDDLTGNAFSLVLSYNVFDEPTVQKKIEVKVKTSNVIIELCPEILKSIT